jgi:microcystin-dependent protein
MKKAIVISIIFACLLVGIAFALPSKLLPVQGKLTNKLGVPLSGTYNITFTIYSGSTTLWTETKQVMITKGMFSTVLGDTTMLNMDFSNDYDLAISINGESMGRQRLLPAPYAMFANVAQNAISAQSAISTQNLQGGFVNASNGYFSANVGIGITQPSEKLDVAGKVKAQGFCIGTSCITSWPEIPLQLNLQTLTTSGNALILGNFNVAGSGSFGGKVITSELCLNNDCKSSWPSGNTYYINQSGSNAGSDLPVGSVTQFAGNTIPIRYLECNGSAVSRTEYPELFAIIGTTYGAGDGNTTFNLPDLRGRVAIGDGQGIGLTNRNLGQKDGEESHILTITEIPSHYHNVYQHAGYMGEGSTVPGASGADTKTLVHPGMTSWAGGNAAHNNMQPFLVIKYIIKAKAGSASANELSIKVLSADPTAPVPGQIWLVQ